MNKIQEILSLKYSRDEMIEWIHTKCETERNFRDDPIMKRSFEIAYQIADMVNAYFEIAEKILNSGDIVEHDSHDPYYERRGEG